MKTYTLLCTYNNVCPRLRQLYQYYTQQGHLAIISCTYPCCLFLVHRFFLHLSQNHLECLCPWQAMSRHFIFQTQYISFQIVLYWLLKTEEHRFFFKDLSSNKPKGLSWGKLFIRSWDMKRKKWTAGTHDYY